MWQQKGVFTSVLFFLIFALMFSEVSADEAGAPKNVKTRVLSSGTVYVMWEDKPEAQGYTVFYTSKANQSLTEWEYQNVGTNPFISISGLVPANMYSIRVRSNTKQGHSKLSKPIQVNPHVGVLTAPKRPRLRSVTSSSADLMWLKPHFDVRLPYSYDIYWREDTVKSKCDLEEIVDWVGSPTESFKLTYLRPNTQYIVWVVARTADDESPRSPPLSFKTEEDAPSGTPTALTCFFPSPNKLSFSWEPPSPDQRNGAILFYRVVISNDTEAQYVKEYNVTATQFTIVDPEISNSDTLFSVNAYTKKGGGPYVLLTLSSQIKLMLPPPIAVKGLATSSNTALIWWEQVYWVEVLGYRVFYKKVGDGEEKLKHKDVHVTGQAELTNLEPGAEYNVYVSTTNNFMTGPTSVPITVAMVPTAVPTNLLAHSISETSLTLSWDKPTKFQPTDYRITLVGRKNYIDGQSYMQQQTVFPLEITVDANITNFYIERLIPFTTYRINVTAVPADNSFRPAISISVTTSMAAPPSMVKPFTVNENNETVTVLLPVASEENGPIRFYYIVLALDDKNLDSPDNYTQEELTSSADPNAPYITAKFTRGSIPFYFDLGDGKEYEGHRNKRLKKNKKYRIFVRAEVDNPEKDYLLYTSSPYSDTLALEIEV